MMSNHCDILFIHPPHHRRIGSGIVLPLGLAYLSAYVRSINFQPMVIDCATLFSSVDEKNLECMKNMLAEKILEIKPKLAVGIGPCITSNIKGTISVAEICKKVIPEIPLIYGGPLTSIPHQNWIFFNILNADAVIPGDGEHALAMLLERIRDKKGIENTMGVITNPKEKIQLNTIQNLNKLPFPARDLFPLSQYKLSVRRELFVNPFANMVVTRGCPFSCPFCLSGTLNNCQRRRSIENILCEIKFLKERYGVRSIVFYDDMIFPNILGPSWLAELFVICISVLFFTLNM